MTLSLAFTALVVAGTLYEQSAARILSERFNSPALSYMLSEASSGRVIASRWPESGRAIFPGSLMKPFLGAALARDAVYNCTGERCWRRAGHGRLSLTDAIAQSCNSYFLAAAASVDPDRIATIAKTYQLAAPENFTAETLIGLGRSWPQSPADLLGAYRLLLADESQSEVRRGLLLSAREGTAHLVKLDALAKTGTAPCSHKVRGEGDGLAIAAWPADTPRYLLLVRVHNTTGANAAQVAGGMVRALAAGR